MRAAVYDLIFDIWLF